MSNSYMQFTPGYIHQGITVIIKNFGKINGIKNLDKKSYTTIEATKEKSYFTKCVQF